MENKNKKTIENLEKVLVRNKMDTLAIKRYIATKKLTIREMVKKDYNTPDFIVRVLMEETR